MRTAGLYLRISRDSTGEGLAVERQRADGMRLIEARGWTLHREYVDNDISASGRKRRPGFEQLLSDVEAGHVTVVVSLSLDRLTRNRRDQVRLIELGQERRVLLSLVRGSDIDMSHASGRLVAGLMAEVAMHEIAVKGERHARQIAQAAAAGQPHGGPRAFGFAADGLTLDPVEAAVVRDLYDQWLTGTDLTSMARALNQSGHVTPQGNSWTRGSVREVLANPRNAALRGMRDVVNKRTGTRAQWHRIVGPAVWQPIVPEETWRAAMARIQDPRRPGSHRGIYPSRHLLSGIARCGVEVDEGECGLALVAGRRDGKRLIRCPSRAHIGRDAQHIEDYVEEAILSHFATAEGREQLSRRQRPETVDVLAARSRSIELHAGLSRLAEDYADGVLDRDQVRVAGERMRAELAGLESQLAVAGARDITDRLLGAVDVDDEWATLPLSLRRELIRRVMRVTVLRGNPGRPRGLRFQPETVRIEWL